MASEIRPDRTVDCRGLLCPMPIVETKRAIATLAVGQILEVLATDPGSKRDMPAFAKNTGNELVEAGEEGKVFRFLIRKSS
ncbi:MAG: sulfurtransferase TusA family protein [Dehalococcoidia bacterium]|nr:sulfurtransferase TusA family protein [Dehalococcoidia bacterium]